jgi:ABC-type uncharacterized transport system auxiliary subunit
VIRSRALIAAILLTVSASGVFVSGCFRRQFPERRQYVVDVERVGPARSMSPVVIKVARVRAEPQYDRKSFVYRTGDATYADDFYNAFYVAPTQMVRSALQRWLADSDLFANVADVDSLVGADWLLESRLLEFYIDKRAPDTDNAVVRLAVTLVDAKESPPRAILERVYEEVRPSARRVGDDYVAAWSSAMTELCVNLEADLAEMLLQRKGR